MSSNVVHEFHVEEDIRHDALREGTTYVVNEIHVTRFSTDDATLEDTYVFTHYVSRAF